MKKKALILLTSISIVSGMNFNSSGLLAIDVKPVVDEAWRKILRGDVNEVKNIFATKGKDILRNHENGIIFGRAIGFPEGYDIKIYDETLVKNRLELLEFLLNKGFDPTSLLYGIVKGTLHRRDHNYGFLVKAFKRTIDKGAKPNKKEGGNTPLHSAVWAGPLPVIRALLEIGANPNIKDDLAGETALEIAKRLKKYDVVEILTAKSGKPIGASPELSRQIQELSDKVDRIDKEVQRIRIKVGLPKLLR